MNAGRGLGLPRLCNAQRNGNSLASCPVEVGEVTLVRVSSAALLALLILVACTDGIPDSEFVDATDTESPLALLDVPELDYANEEGFEGILITGTGRATEWSDEQQAIRFTPEGMASTVVRIGDTIRGGGGEIGPAAAWLSIPEGCPDGDAFEVNSLS